MPNQTLEEIFSLILGGTSAPQDSIRHQADLLAMQVAAHNPDMNPGYSAEIAAMASLFLNASCIKGEMSLQSLYALHIGVAHNAFTKYLVTLRDSLEAAGPDHHAHCNYKAEPEGHKYHDLHAFIGHLSTMDVMRGNGQEQFYPARLDAINEAISDTGWLATEAQHLSKKVGDFAKFDLAEKEPNAPAH